MFPHDLLNDAAAMEPYVATEDYWGGELCALIFQHCGPDVVGMISLCAQFQTRVHMNDRLVYDSPPTTQYTGAYKVIWTSC